MTATGRIQTMQTTTNRKTRIQLLELLIVVLLIIISLLIGSFVSEPIGKVLGGIAVMYLIVRWLIDIISWGKKE